MNQNPFLSPNLEKFLAAGLGLGVLFWVMGVILISVGAPTLVRAFLMIEGAFFFILVGFVSEFHAVIGYYWEKLSLLLIPHKKLCLYLNYHWDYPLNEQLFLKRVKGR